MLALLDPECYNLMEYIALPTNPQEAYETLKQAMKEIFYVPNKPPNQFIQEFYSRIQAYDE